MGYWNGIPGVSDHKEGSHHFVPSWSRRAALLGGAAAAGGLLVRPLLRQAQADVGQGGHRFISLFFDGGWDVLLAGDARDPSQTYAGIDLGTELLSPQYQDPIPVVLAGKEYLWGAPMKNIVDHGHTDVITVFRGVNMNTVAHETGRAYANTFIEPAGTSPRGSSLGTFFAQAGFDESILMPNFSIGLPSFNPDLDQALSAVSVDAPSEVASLMKRLGGSGANQTEALLKELQDQLGSCVGSTYSGERPVDELQVARARMRDLLASNYAEAFDFNATDLSIFNTNANNASAPGNIAAALWRLLELGLSCSVSARLVKGLDSHRDWAGNHPWRLRDGFDALSALLTRLREDDPNLENTTVVVHSEFARTARINGTAGRDHNFANTILVFGGGLRRGVCGSTVEDTLGLLTIDTTTGEPLEGGHMLIPEDIGATLSASLGLNTEEFRVDPLSAWIA